MAVGKRPSPSAAPQEDWPCGVVGSGFTTQQRLRSPTAGVVTPGPSCIAARRTPSQRHLTLHSCYQTSRPTCHRKPRRAIAAHAKLRAQWLPCNVKHHHWGKALRALPLNPVLGMGARQFSGVVALCTSSWDVARQFSGVVALCLGGNPRCRSVRGRKRMLRAAKGHSLSLC